MWDCVARLTVITELLRKSSQIHRKEFAKQPLGTAHPGCDIRGAIDETVTDLD